jgi:uncharacterized protein (DUF1800 family)
VAPLRNVQALAEGLRAHELNIGWGVATVLRSRAFFAAENLGTRVVDPAPFVIGTARALELAASAPSTLLLAEWMGRMGQDLFYPSNVGGWPGGRAWLAPGDLIVRANYAAAAALGTDIGLAAPLDVAALLGRYGVRNEVDAAITFLAEILLGAEPGGGWHERIAAAACRRAAWGPVVARRVAAMVVASPEAQLG